jgi:hypothetical protein
MTLYDQVWTVIRVFTLSSRTGALGLRNHMPSKSRSPSIPIPSET